VIFLGLRFSALNLLLYLTLGRVTRRISGL